MEGFSVTRQSLLILFRTQMEQIEIARMCVLQVKRVYTFGTWLPVDPIADNW